MQKVNLLVYFFYYKDQSDNLKKEQIIGPDNASIFTTLNGFTKHKDKFITALSLE